MPPETVTEAWRVIRERCPACGGEASVPYAERRGVEAVRCVGCRLVYVRAAAPEAAGAFTEIYDAQYFDKYLRHSGYARRMWRDRGRARLMRRFHAPGRLLDVGCSVGHFLEAAALEGWEAWGVEPSAFAAEFAGRRGSRVFHGTLEQARYPRDHFDAVAMWHVIEHLPALHKTMAEVQRVLRPGGLLALLTPNIEHPAARLKGPRWKHIHHEHLQLFSHRTLPPFLESIGFKPVLCRWVYRHSEVLVFAVNDK